MSSRAKYLQEMQELRQAIEKTKSTYLKRDYGKALKRKERELREYDRWKRN